MKKKNEYLRFISALLCVLLAASMVPVSHTAKAEEATPTTATSATTGRKVIVSLGDSYSSGEGIEPFYNQEKPRDEKVHDPDWLAHRSTLSWPGLLTLPYGFPLTQPYQQNGIDAAIIEKNRNTDANPDGCWYFVASSGATTADLLGKQEKEYNWFDLLSADNVSSRTTYLAPQLDVFQELEAKGLKADYVTVTIGGNDLHFSEAITKVAIGSTYINFDSIYDAFQDIHSILPESESLSELVVRLWEEWTGKGGIRDKIHMAYYDIAEAAGPQAKIIVAGYPQLLDPTGKGLPISKEEAQIINHEIQVYNRLMENIVDSCRNEGMNIYFVSVEEAFEQNRAYSEDPYINPIMLKPRSEDLKQASVGSSYSMHPNEKGVAEYANCVKEKIDELESNADLNIIERIIQSQYASVLGATYAQLAERYGMPDRACSMADYYTSSNVLYQRGPLKEIHLGFDDMTFPEGTSFEILDNEGFSTVVDDIAMTDAIHAYLLQENAACTYVCQLPITNVYTLPKPIDPTELGLTACDIGFEGVYTEGYAGTYHNIRMEFSVTDGLITNDSTVTLMRPEVPALTPAPEPAASVPPEPTPNVPAEPVKESRVIAEFRYEEEYENQERDAWTVGDSFDLNCDGMPERIDIVTEREYDAYYAMSVNVTDGQTGEVFRYPMDDYDGDWWCYIELYVLDMNPTDGQREFVITVGDEYNGKTSLYIGRFMDAETAVHVYPPFYGAVEETVTFNAFTWFFGDSTGYIDYQYHADGTISRISDRNRFNEARRTKCEIPVQWIENDQYTDGTLPAETDITIVEGKPLEDVGYKSFVIFVTADGRRGRFACEQNDEYDMNEYVMDERGFLSVNGIPDFELFYNVDYSG